MSRARCEMSSDWLGNKIVGFLSSKLPCIAAPLRSICGLELDRCIAFDEVGAISFSSSSLFLLVSLTFSSLLLSTLRVLLGFPDICPHSLYHLPNSNSQSNCSFWIIKIKKYRRQSGSTTSTSFLLIPNAQSKSMHPPTSLMTKNLVIQVNQ